MEAAGQSRSRPPSQSPGGDVFIADYWGEALRHVSRHYNLPQSTQSALQAAAWNGGIPARERIRSLARDLGLRVVFSTPERSALTSWHTPFLLQMRSGLVGVVTSLGESGEAAITFAGEQRLEQTLTLDFLLRHAELVAIARPERSGPDARVDAYVRPFEENWLRRIVLADVKPYLHVMLASLVANTLGLAGVLFSMQVYDRVVPAESLSTLYVLFSGVLLALGFDFVLRRLRLGIVDILGKRADLRMSDQVFGHALRVRNRARPLSTGSFIAQLRDLEQIRELLTSTTVTALVDMPFFLLFLAIFWHIGGALVLVPLGGLLALLAPGLLAQRRLRAHSIDARREASMRNAMLVEAVQGIEDIKTLQAEGRFQQQWNHLNATTATAQLRQRSLTNALGVWTHNVQTAVYAVTVLVGAPMVISGDITTGALVGASILGSRMMAPLAQLSQILGRLQQAKVAMQSLDQLMQMPVDHPLDEARIHCPRIAGGYAVKSAVFRYADETSPTALMVRELHVRPGEKIGLLGRNGAGKSTLLQALSGLLEPSSGEVLLDDMALHHIDPADVRRDVGYLSQNARLFHGTIRENLTLGAPHAAEEEILAALAMVGALDFIRKLPKGLDHLIQEGGGGLSGGQRQSLLLARLVIRQPSVVLLDEPTASMDEATERHFISQFLKWSGNRTVVIATHRMRVLELVDRLIVVENGQVALDNGKENALRKLRGLSPVPAAGAGRQDQA